MNSQEMNVRLASKSDAKAISEILRIAFAYSFRNEANASEVDEYVARLSEEFVLEQLQSSECSFCVLEHNMCLYGCAQITTEPPNEMDESPAWLKLERLYIDPKRIGTGAGRQLMDAFISMAKEREIPSLWLQVLRTNIRAIKFYSAYGFETFNTSPGKFKADGELDLWMRKEL